MILKVPQKNCPCFKSLLDEKNISGDEVVLQSEFVCAIASKIYRMAPQVKL